MSYQTPNGMAPQQPGVITTQQPVVTSPTACMTCGLDLGPSGVVGFCGQCGGTLCLTHAEQTRKVTGQMTDTTPLLVVNVRKTTSLELQVPVCKACTDREGAAYKAHGKKLLWIPIVLAIVVFASIMWLMSWNGICYALIASIGLFFVVFLFLNWLFVGRKGHEVKLVFACPVCGANLMDYYLEMAKHQPQGSAALPNFITCPTCRYAGPRRPYDGLFKFVDKYGPTPLEGTPIRNMAYQSYYVRHGQKPA